MFNKKSQFLDLETAQLEPMLVMVFSPIALSIDPVPFYPLHASQAEPQKASHLCVLLLQVASLGDFTDISDIILTPSSCIRPHVGGILMYLT